jgi:serine/threonine-protein kinase HipA
MAKSICETEVRIWKHRVGGLAELDTGEVYFEFDESFRRTGLDISPRLLPLSLQGTIQFLELARLEAFHGLPGVFADALPDRFGNAVIRAYFESQGRPDHALSPIQRLLYIGTRAMGALEFHPPRAALRTIEREAIEIATLVKEARRIIQGHVKVALPEIMRLGSSAGGARAKAIVLWNRKANVIRSAFAPMRPGDEHWMVKFDGVGDVGAPNPKPQPFNRIEHAYAQMARMSGLGVPETELLMERGLAHLMVRRFDRQGGQRLHLHSLGGMEHVDFNQPGAFSYEQYFRLVQFLDLGHDSLEEAFRRACFNVLAVNRDDHVKNFSFLMDAQGSWRLSPAYDLTFAHGAGFTQRHQMSLAGKREEITVKDLLSVGDRFSLRRGGREIVARVIDSLSEWPKLAKDSDVPAKSIRDIARIHDRIRSADAPAFVRSRSTRRAR